MKNINVMVIGLKQSGKSSLIKCIKGESFSESIPAGDIATHSELSGTTFVPLKLCSAEESSTPDSGVHVRFFEAGKDYDWAHPAAFRGINIVLITMDLPDYSKDASDFSKHVTRAAQRSGGPGIEVIYVGTKLDKNEHLGEHMRAVLADADVSGDFSYKEDAFFLTSAREERRDFFQKIIHDYCAKMEICEQLASGAKKEYTIKDFNADFLAQYNSEIFKFSSEMERLIRLRGDTLTFQDVFSHAASNGGRTAAVLTKHTGLTFFQTVPQIPGRTGPVTSLLVDAEKEAGPLSGAGKAS